MDRPVVCVLRSRAPLSYRFCICEVSRCHCCAAGRRNVDPDYFGVCRTPQQVRVFKAIPGGGWPNMRATRLSDMEPNCFRARWPHEAEYERWGYSTTSTFWQRTKVRLLVADRGLSFLPSCATNALFFGSERMGEWDRTGIPLCCGSWRAGFPAQAYFLGSEASPFGSDSWSSLPPLSDFSA